MLISSPLISAVVRPTRWRSRFLRHHLVRRAERLRHRQVRFDTKLFDSLTKFGNLWRISAPRFQGVRRKWSELKPNHCLHR